MPALLATPPAPNPQPQQGQSALAGPAQTPAPSHEQTVAAMRHFRIVGKKLYQLLKNPELGRTDIKDAMIKMATEFVADRILPAEQAVTLLRQLPERPYEQKQFVSQLMTINLRAQVAVLDHHRASHQGSGNPALEMAQHSDTSDDHLDMLGSIGQHYGGAHAGP